MIPLEDIQKYTKKIFARSSGPGGQNVNKTSTKVMLIFDIKASNLVEKEKWRLLSKFPDGYIRIVNQDTRSQLQNIRRAFKQLQRRMRRSLKVDKPRKKTKAPHETRRGKIKKMLKDKWLKYKQRYVR